MIHATHLNRTKRHFRRDDLITVVRDGEEMRTPGADVRVGDFLPREGFLGDIDLVDIVRVDEDWPGYTKDADARS